MKIARGMLAALLVFLSACGGGNDSGSEPPPPPPPPVPVASVTVDSLPVRTRFGVGESFKYSVTVKDSAGQTLTGRTVTWTSSAPDVVFVSQTGVAIARGPGTANITALSEGKSASVDTTVIPAGYLRIVPAINSVTPGQSLQLSALATDESGQLSATNVTWMSSAPTVAAVSSSGGLLTAVAEGKTIITAVRGDFSVDAEFSVQQPVLGKIMFHSARLAAPVPTVAPHGGLFVMNPDGSDQSLLREDYMRACSPDGGSLTCSVQWGTPALTRDGMRFASTSSRIYAPEFSGSQIFLCTTVSALCLTLNPFPQTLMPDGAAMPLLGTMPSWSSDGQRLAYVSDGIQIWSASDYRFTKVTSTDAFSIDSLAWSPNGTGIAMSARRLDDVGADPELWVINVDGTGLVRLTDNGVADKSPVWSPDGARIAFSTFVNDDQEIFVMNADGTAPVNLTQTTGSDAEPSWSPDGSQIAFQSLRDGNYEIYVMDQDGTDQHDVSNHPADDVRPVWGP